ncbi:radical SAM family heme chaperone HemW [Marinobacter nanhaiticus D15-8W]|uniref:Heme chaperone HemW n=1 Tax=Marinobacter nanhaiticus D15-8W TaxID=626887 RepID=N6VWM5_9GAMM|nr:radical SAM family heme chaperone HemW [Marinobacter nanhaiticus]ENO14655.1 radical SAM family heme chaperone HemW [Marinobacter nanhaiticus D15-8W]BES69658.1 radical SAM family heme chaperone HemW [Marinobacter nanhaiticus D15-8W]
MIHHHGALQLPPLSLYIHVPWCVRKCPYCDFNSHALKTDIPEDAYLDALEADLKPDLAGVQGRAIETVFIGGGTPSLMSADFYGRLFELLGNHLSFAADAEITLEANPGTVEQARFEGFRKAGINRLSLGIQSFDPKQLHKLGRIHDDQDAHRAITTAREAGFDNFNLDLMHGLPGQTVEQALADLDSALQYAPPHLSWYQLTLEPNTEFYSRPPDLPEDDQLWDIHQAGHGHLRKNGYTPYEISAWCQPGRASRHNLNYWRFGDYLALGAGAHGKITFADNGEIRRFWKTRQPEAYLQRLGSRTAGQQVLEREDLPLEFMMNVLRLEQGVEEAAFEARTGLPLQEIAAILSALRSDGLLEKDRLQATPLGQRYLNSILERFLS